MTHSKKDVIQQTKRTIKQKTKKAIILSFIAPSLTVLTVFIVISCIDQIKKDAFESYASYAGIGITAAFVFAAIYSCSACINNYSDAIMTRKLLRIINTQCTICNNDYKLDTLSDGGDFVSYKEIETRLVDQTQDFLYYADVEVEKKKYRSTHNHRLIFECLHCGYKIIFRMNNSRLDMRSINHGYEIVRLNRNIDIILICKTDLIKYLIKRHWKQSISE